MKAQIGVTGNKEVRMKSVWNTALEAGREVAWSGAILMCGKGPFWTDHRHTIQGQEEERRPPHQTIGTWIQRNVI